MQSRFRLTKTTDIQRVRSKGKSIAHPLIVLVMHPGDPEKSRFAVIAGRRVGKAVQRNRAKRLIRAAIQVYLPKITTGMDIVFIARARMGSASYQSVEIALGNLLERAQLI